MTELEIKIEQKIENKINSLGYKLYDLEYVQENKDYFLRIYIDKKEKITLEDCEIVSNNINEILENIIELKDKYFLEVSSPGLERVLKKDEHLKENIGKKVKIKLIEKIEKNKIYNGRLKEFNKNEIIIEIENKKSLTINKNNIIYIKTIYDW